MSELTKRIANQELLRKVLPVEEAVRVVGEQDTIAVSGFTKSGEPKTFIPALANHLSRALPRARLSLFSGASLSDQVENPLSPFIRKRSPYMSSSASRKLIHSGKMDFSDVHLSSFSRNLMYGFYGEIDLAVIEVSRILPDGSVVLTSSIGMSPEALAKAKRVILEVNVAGPDYSGFHDIILPPVPPTVGWPIPILGVRDRIGSPVATLDPKKVVAVVESRIPDYPIPFRLPSEEDRQIAQNVVEFLLLCRERLGWGDTLPPLQSGVGNVANAVLTSLYDSPFRRIQFWTEVFQDGMLSRLEEDELFDCASATAVSFSEEARTKFERLFDACRKKLVLRPMWLTNSAELITRLFVIAMNTPIEVDIYGHVNSTHIDGSKVVNGLGGSGDFLRNAYISIVHTPSIRTLRDGRTVSCVMPYVRHIDHTEHDIKCIVTEQGYAVNSDIRSPKKRAEDLISRCAHPHFRPLLFEYLKIAGGGDEPRPTDLQALDNWWIEYNKACLEFPAEKATERRAA